MEAELKERENNKFNLSDFIELPEFSNFKGRGLSFLITPLDKYSLFSREQFSEEQKMFGQTAYEFAVNRIKPVKDQLKVLNKDLSLQIFKEAGELGFLGIDVPEEYGGMDLDKTTAGVVLDYMSSCECASIMVTISAHTGIGVLPIVWYGNEEQKKKYLPKLSSGEWMGCYALTEPNAGSDALSGEMVATLNEEGTHYILNGQKIYITNGAWANVCVTFAKVGDKYTGFIVESGMEGFVVGAEEKKMGIKGSSTVTLFFENCKVPIENVLGDVGQGGAIAFNSLYVGRYKLGITAASGSKTGLKTAFEFALNRKQFSRPITEFAMIKNKFSKMIVKIWESDTVCYATTGSIDDYANKLDKKDVKYYDKLQKVIEDHGVEASICKIVGSETLAYCVDEGVQIYGGAGFIEEYPVAEAYRDERINRIFEGTNEINRLIISSITLKKSIMEELPVRDQIFHREENWSPDLSFENHELSKEISIIEFCRSLTLNVLHELILKYGQDLKNEQWVLEPFADMITSFSIMQMGFTRYNQLSESDHKTKTLPVLKYSLFYNFNKLIKDAKELLNYLGNQKMNIDKINDMVKEFNWEVDTIALKEEICEEFYRHKKYYLD
ncbi:MAG: acyl-CoA dehydrogenase [Candidatus Marinimicrobia bacterium]|nr:acyl-CoA dehydrogenase [Candidatus Neomarinimicrobiota bacterium]